MKGFITILFLVGLQLPAVAMADRGRGCSDQMLAGRWVFATDVGHQALLNAPALPGGITAMGTMNINHKGEITGAFDVTFEGGVFIPGIPYAGTVMINEDCTGTLSFRTEAPSERTDSILVINRSEIWGMSQDPHNLWTYKVRRVPGSHRFSDND